ncbi:hypothetical protein FAES_5270 [Fibrella aestuarina BUZ 2]|uniref:DoxX family protein n=1 Tax=Fibrella aestuarina BUZ 2 TaxID=1166018 RepID=I0KGL6_9BACT|nr:DoxX family protein [Fibrella aestuarina]CCH03269.1 hypothetical protein FAES_5270 [Fibrella aestuarina BUZ 2]
MKTINTIYWIATGLFAFVMLGSAIPDIIVMPEAVQGFKEIGLPAYLLPLVGWAKLLGVIALLVPGFPRLREWAYAGLMIDILGAIYCIAMSGKPLGTWAPIIVIPIVGYVSYVYYHKRLLAAATPSARGPLVGV